MTNSRLGARSRGSHLYFAYGSNLNRGDMRARCAGCKPLAPARLGGWRLTFRGVADIEPALGRAVLGALWLVGSSDLRSLDHYEGAPTYYRRHVVRVEAGSGQCEATTYVMNDSGYRGLPSDWYYERIARGYRDWALPTRPLELAVEEVRKELEALGVTRYRPEGRKRLRAIIDEVPADAR